MPNHVTTRMVVTGDMRNLRRFRKECIRLVSESGSEEQLDFNAILPMPKALKDAPACCHNDIGYAAWYGPERSSSIGTYGWMDVASFDWCKAKTREELQEKLLKRDPKYKTAADVTKANMDKYGARSWYDWAIRHWGTKWNSYDFAWVSEERLRLEFVFETAWSPPIPVFGRMALFYPSLHFDIKSFDEGWNFAMVGEIQADFLNTYRDVRPTDEVYEAVYGEKPVYDKEDDGK